MPRSASRAVVLALALTGATWAGRAAAEEPPPDASDPAAAYEAARRPSRARAAGLLEPAASFAMSNRLRRTGADLFARILEIDPDHARARRELGFERKGDAWVPVEEKRKALEDFEDESEKKRPEFERKLREAQPAAAKALAELGELAERASRPEEARDLWRMALRLDDQNALANERAGNRLVDGKWLTERALRHREFRKAYDASLAAARKLEVAVDPAQETTGLLQKAGLEGKAQCFRTKHFRIESVLPAGAVKAVLVDLERARRFFLDLYRLPDHLVDFEAEPMVLVVTVNDEQRDRVLDACDRIPERDRAFKKKFGATAVTPKLHLARYQDEATAKAEGVHAAAHSFAQHAFGSHAPWLYDALANTVAAAVLRTRLKVCFTGRGSTAGIALEHLDLEKAPSVLREVVLKRRDTPAAELTALSSDLMAPKDIAKCWSLVLFLLERDPDRTRQYLQGAGRAGDGSLARDAKVLAEHFPEYPGWKDLDEAWRAWVLEAYRGAK